MIVGSEFSGIPVNPQHHVWAHSVEMWRWVKTCCRLKFLQMHFTTNFRECVFMCSLNVFEQAYLTNFYEEACPLKFQSAKVTLILLVSTFWYCGPRRCVGGSKGFLKILSPLSYVGSARFCLSPLSPLRQFCVTNPNGEDITKCWP